MKIRSLFAMLVPLMISTAVISSCGGVSTANSADDLQKMQGSWKLRSCLYDGEPQPGNMEWIFSGDHYNMRVDGQTHADPYMIKLDAAKNHIDVFHHDTPPGTIGGKLKGIYRLSGNSLTICYDLTEQYYPQSFDAPRGSRRVVYEFRRE